MCDYKLTVIIGCLYMFNYKLNYIVYQINYIIHYTYTSISFL